MWLALRDTKDGLLHRAHPTVSRKLLTFPSEPPCCPRPRHCFQTNLGKSWAKVGGREQRDQARPVYLRLRQPSSVFPSAWKTAGFSDQEVPDYLPLVNERLLADPQRLWKPAELLDLVTDDRDPPGEYFAYTNTNYLLLGLVIEQVRGRPIAEVLRDGVLSIDGVERLIYQPDEIPTEPMAMPYGESTDVLEIGDGFLPSLALTSDGPAAAMASDSPSLARWWRAFCTGEIVSQASLTEMTTFHDDYGLGLYNPGDSYANVVGHTGESEGYVAWAGCLPEDGSVVVVLSNRVVEDIGAMPRPLVDAALSD